MQILHEIRMTDARSKGIGNNSVEDADLMRELVYKILH
jgi:DNA polymerase-3 subunit delta